MIKTQQTIKKYYRRYLNTLEYLKSMVNVNRLNKDRKSPVSFKPMNIYEFESEYNFERMTTKNKAKTIFDRLAFGSSNILTDKQLDNFKLIDPTSEVYQKYMTPELEEMYNKITLDNSLENKMAISEFYYAFKSELAKNGLSIEEINNVISQEFFAS